MVLRTPTNKLDNEGFSLVEVIIAVSILAIVFTPVLKSFTTAARVNSKAQLIQSATSLAEDVMEKVKSTSIEEHFTEATASGTVIGDSDIGKGNVLFLSGSEATSYINSGTYSAESTDYKYAPYVIKYSDVTATSGKKYDAEVIVSTDPYDQSNEIDASDANKFNVPTLTSVDSTQHAVLSWEINSYDASAIDRLADEYTTSSVTRSAIKTAAATSGLKTTYIELEEEAGMVKVSCNTQYIAGGAYTDPISFLVYSGYFTDISSSSEIGGPNIYLFYTTMKKATGNSEFFKNEKIYVNDKTIAKKHNIYLIFQNGLTSFQDTSNGAGNTINISLDIEENGVKKQNIQDIMGAAIPLTNTYELNGTTFPGSQANSRFYTNAVFGVGQSNMYDSKNKDRLYYVSVKLRKHGDTSGEIYATLNSTMSTGAEADNR